MTHHNIEGLLVFTKILLTLEYKTESKDSITFSLTPASFSNPPTLLQATSFSTEVV